MHNRLFDLQFQCFQKLSYSSPSKLSKINIKEPFSKLSSSFSKRRIHANLKACFKSRITSPALFWIGQKWVVTRWPPLCSGEWCDHLFLLLLCKSNVYLATSIPSFWVGPALRSFPMLLPKQKNPFSMELKNSKPCSKGKISILLFNKEERNCHFLNSSIKILFVTSLLISWPCSLLKKASTSSSTQSGICLESNPPPFPTPTSQPLMHL